MIGSQLDSSAKKLDESQNDQPIPIESLDEQKLLHQARQREIIFDWQNKPEPEVNRKLFQHALKLYHLSCQSTRKHHSYAYANSYRKYREFVGQLSYGNDWFSARLSLEPLEEMAWKKAQKYQQTLRVSILQTSNLSAALPSGPKALTGQLRLNAQLLDDQRRKLDEQSLSLQRYQRLSGNRMQGHTVWMPKRHWITGQYEKIDLNMTSRQLCHDPYFVIQLQYRPDIPLHRLTFDQLCGGYRDIKNYVKFKRLKPNFSATRQFTPFSKQPMTQPDSKIKSTVKKYLKQPKIHSNAGGAIHPPLPLISPQVRTIGWMRFRVSSLRPGINCLNMQFACGRQPLQILMHVYMLLHCKWWKGGYVHFHYFWEMHALILERLFLLRLKQRETSLENAVSDSTTGKDSSEATTDKTKDSSSLFPTPPPPPSPPTPPPLSTTPLVQSVKKIVKFDLNEGKDLSSETPTSFAQRFETNVPKVMSTSFQIQSATEAGKKAMQRWKERLKKKKTIPKQKGKKFIPSETIRGKAQKSVLNHLPENLATKHVEKKGKMKKIRPQTVCRKRKDDDKNKLKQKKTCSRAYLMTKTQLQRMRRIKLLQKIHPMLDYRASLVRRPQIVALARHARYLDTDGKLLKNEPLMVLSSPPGSQLQVKPMVSQSFHPSKLEFLLSSETEFNSSFMDWNGLENRTLFELPVILSTSAQLHLASKRLPSSFCVCSEWCNVHAFYYFNPLGRFLAAQNQRLFALPSRLVVPIHLLSLCQLMRKMNGQLRCYNLLSSLLQCVSSSLIRLAHISQPSRRHLWSSRFVDMLLSSYVQLWELRRALMSKKSTMTDDDEERHGGSSAKAPPLAGDPQDIEYLTSVLSWLSNTLQLIRNLRSISVSMMELEF